MRKNLKTNNLANRTKTHHMTKTQEIVALQNFVASLPNETYLRPWLESIFPDIERAIRSDFLIEASPTESARQCALELAQAQHKAQVIIASAERERERILIAANHESQKIRDEAAARRCEIRNKLAAVRETITNDLLSSLSA